jgi:hypothetical protein
MASMASAAERTSIVNRGFDQEPKWSLRCSAVDGGLVSLAVAVFHHVHHVIFNHIPNDVYTHVIGETVARAVGSAILFAAWPRETG